MKHFIHVEECHESNYIMIAFLIFLHCFEKFNYDYYYQGTDTETEFNLDNDIENQYNKEMHCNALQFNKVMHEGSSNDEIVSSSTERIVGCNLIQDMYEVAQDVMIAFLMTLHCFKKLNYYNYYQWTDTEIAFNLDNDRVNQYNEEMHCNVLQFNEVMHEGSSNDEMVNSSTECIVGCNLIQDMYEVAKDISLSDMPLLGLPVPPLEMDNRLRTVLIQVMFQCVESNQPYKQWLGKEKALEVSCLLVFANNVKEVHGTNKNVILLFYPNG
jgi:hypothetical protein